MTPEENKIFQQLVKSYHSGHFWSDFWFAMGTVCAVGLIITSILLNMTQGG